MRSERLQPNRVVGTTSTTRPAAAGLTTPQAPPATATGPSTAEGARLLTLDGADVRYRTVSNPLPTHSPCIFDPQPGTALHLLTHFFPLVLYPLRPSQPRSSTVMRTTCRPSSRQCLSVAGLFSPAPTATRSLPRVTPPLHTGGSCKHHRSVCGTDRTGAGIMWEPTLAGAGGTRPKTAEVAVGGGPDGWIRPAGAVFRVLGSPGASWCGSRYVRGIDGESRNQDTRGSRKPDGWESRSPQRRATNPFALSDRRLPRRPQPFIPYGRHLGGSSARSQAVARQPPAAATSGDDRSPSGRTCPRWRRAGRDPPPAPLSAPTPWQNSAVGGGLTICWRKWEVRGGSGPQRSPPS